MNGLSLIIPAFNEEAGLGRVLDHVARVQATLPCPLEVIVIDDGSSARTAEIAHTKPVVLIRHPVNLG